MWAPMPPAAYPSQVGTRHKVNEREPSVYDLGEKATPACPAIGAATLTSGIHLRPPGGKQRARKRMDSCWDLDLSQAGVVRKDRSESGHQAPVPTLLPWHPSPQGPGLYSNDALSCTYRVRSKVIVKAAAGKRCSPELWKLLSTFCPASNSDLVFLLLIHEGEFLVWLPRGSSRRPVWPSKSWAALLKDA